MDAPIIVKKKKSHDHPHHGGSWKVAYADFVTAMMAFFMVMWIMGLSDQTRAQIQGYFNDPIGFMKTMPNSRTVVPIKSVPMSKPGPVSPNKDQPFEAEKKALQALKDQVEKALEADPLLKKLLEHVDIKITAEGLRIEFLEDKNDFFESGQAVLKPSAIHLINLLGPKLAQSGRMMTVEGHTDSVPFGGDPLGNYTLSSSRAAALAVALGHAGVKPEKLRSVTGLADRELRDPDHPRSAVNRRVTILLPFGSNVSSTELMPKDDVENQVKGAAMPHEKVSVPTVQVQPGKPNFFGP